MIKILVILACLGLSKYVQQADGIRQFGWLFNWYRLLTARFSALSPALLLGATILPVVFVVQLLLWFFGHWFGGILGLLLQICIVYMCWGPQNFFAPTEKKVESYFALVNRQWFAVFFWYFILGIPGVVFYRLLSLLAEEAPVGELANTILLYVDWLSARVLAVCYVLVGHFDQAWPYLMSNIVGSPNNTATFLVELAMKAVKVEPGAELGISQALQLVLYAMLLLVTVFLVLTIAVWL